MSEYSVLIVLVIEILLKSCHFVRIIKFIRLGWLLIRSFLILLQVKRKVIGKKHLR